MFLHSASEDSNQTGQMSLQRSWSFKSVSSEIYIWTASWHHDKTKKVAYVPSEDSDQPTHPPSLIGVFTVHSMGKTVPMYLHRASEDSHQTGLPRLIWVFTRRRCHFVMWRLIDCSERIHSENHYMWKTRQSNISSCLVRCQATDLTIFILLLQSSAGCKRLTWLYLTIPLDLTLLVVKGN